MNQIQVNSSTRGPEVLRVHIAARKIGCSPRTVRRLIQRGVLPAQRFGQRAWLLFNHDVESLRLTREASW